MSPVWDEGEKHTIWHTGLVQSQTAAWIGFLFFLFLLLVFWCYWLHIIYCEWSDLICVCLIHIDFYGFKNNKAERRSRNTVLSLSKMKGLHIKIKIVLEWSVQSKVRLLFSALLNFLRLSTWPRFGCVGFFLFQLSKKKENGRRWTVWCRGTLDDAMWLSHF